ncbi:MAG: stage III sporulation protein AE [Clostridia bacterium]|nr:stage III sporulation protein AE [Clostridia bacterium]
MKRKLIIAILIIILILPFSINVKNIKAQSINEVVDEQIENINFGELEEFINNNNIILPNGINGFLENVEKLIKGEYSLNFSDIFSSVISITLINVKEYLPILLSIVVVAILVGVIESFKSSKTTEEVSKVINAVCIIAVAILVSNILIKFFIETKTIIETQVKLSEIMSPIIFSLMIVSGGNVSAGIYQPVVFFLTSGIMQIVQAIIFPIIIIITTLTFIGEISPEIKLNGIKDFFSSLLKWIFGIIITIFSVFITIQGLGASIFDSVSLKIAKYSLSNGIPIIGGLVKDGFDIVLCGSILIKNSIGVTALIILLYNVLSPIISLTVFSLSFKLIAGVISPISSNNKISAMCTDLSKSVSYLIAVILMVSLMFFILFLFIIMSANTVL